MTLSTLPVCESYCSNRTLLIKVSVSDDRDSIFLLSIFFRLIPANYLRLSSKCGDINNARKYIYD